MSAGVRAPARPLLGSALVLGASVGYATMPIFTKIAYDHGADPLGVLVFRFDLVVPWMLLYLLRRRRPRGLRPMLPRLALIAAIFSVQALSFCESLAHMSAVLTVLLLFAYPLLVAAGAAAFLGERLTAASGAIVVTGTLGIVLAVGVSGRATLAGVVLALLAALTFAVFFLLSKELLDRALDGFTLMTLVSAFAAVAYTTIALLLPGGRMPADATGWGVMLAAATFGTGAPAVMLLSGLQHLSAGSAAMFSAIEPAVAVVLAAIVLAEPVSPTQVLGIAILVGALGALGLGVRGGERDEAPTA